MNLSQNTRLILFRYLLFHFSFGMRVAIRKDKHPQIGNQVFIDDSAVLHVSHAGNFSPKSHPLS